MEPILKPGDILLTRGRGVLRMAVRIFTQEIGEKRSIVNHAGLVVTEGTLRTAEVVEALTIVRRHRLWEQYGPPETGSFVVHRSSWTAQQEILKQYGPPRKSLVSVYRPKTLTNEQIGLIVDYAKKMVNEGYGYKLLFAHLGDFFLCGSRFFRRLVKDGKYPVCSWLVARAYQEAGEDFGAPFWTAQPDDIWDYCRSNKDKYSLVYPLSRLS